MCVFELYISRIIVYIHLNLTSFAQYHRHAYSIQLYQLFEKWFSNLVAWIYHLSSYIEEFHLLHMLEDSWYIFFIFSILVGGSVLHCTFSWFLYVNWLFGYLLWSSCFKSFVHLSKYYFYYFKAILLFYKLIGSLWYCENSTLGEQSYEKEKDRTNNRNMISCLFTI